MRRRLGDAQEDVKMDVLDGGPVEGFVGFFDVQFRGSPENPTDFPVGSYASANITSSSSL